MGMGIILALLLANTAIASAVGTMPPENRVIVKNFNDLLVNYFKQHCQGADDNAQCPVLKQLTPHGAFNKTVAAPYTKNYHFFIFNDQWIWVGHGLFQKIIGANHKDFQGADGKYFAQAFRQFVDQHEQGYFEYTEPKAFGGFKNVAYLHRLTFKDGSELIFGTCYNVPTKMIDPALLKDLTSENK
jgi:hypothetical protein